MARGLILAAPSSGSGKTSLTFGLLAALRPRVKAAQGFKTGPDYIDPQYHRIAADRPCPNLDPWAMRPQTVFDTLQRGSVGADLCLIEGVMGLFDGAPEPTATGDRAGATGTAEVGGNASTASLAKSLDLPVVLIVDAKGQSQSVAALVRLCRLRPRPAPRWRHPQPGRLGPPPGIAERSPGNARAGSASAGRGAAAALARVAGAAPRPDPARRAARYARAGRPVGTAAAGMH